MQFNHLITPLVIPVLGLFATASYAAGGSLDLSAPTSAVQGSTVTITIRGRGTCGTQIRFGDGRSGRIANRAFPHKYTHRYTRPGTMAVNANVTGAGCSSVMPLTARIKILARTIKLPGVGKPPIRKISPGKLQLRRPDPALKKRLRVGIPAVTCGGRRATIVGTPGNDMLRGTRGDDVIHGLGGNDTIYGLGGNDIICGGSGNDKLYGGSGNDQLYGEIGYDQLYGGYGNDRLYGGPDNDDLDGGPNNDKLYGGTGNDRLRGGPDHDTLRGESGSDWLYGERGDDRLYGGSGYDRCDGGAGRDSATDGSCETRSNITFTFTILPLQ